MNIDWALNQDAIYRRLVSQSGWNVATYAADVPVKVWFNPVQRLIRAANGEEEIADANIKTALNISPQPNDLFIYEGQAFRVISAGTPATIYGEVGHRNVFAKAAAVDV